MLTYIIIEEPCRTCHPDAPLIVHVATGKDKASAAQPIWEDNFDRGRQLITLTLAEADALGVELMEKIGEARRAKP